MSDILLYAALVPGVFISWTVAAVIFIGGCKEMHRIIKDWRR